MKKILTSKIPVVLCSCLATLLFCFNLSLANEAGPPKGGVDHQILMKHLLNLSNDQVEAMKTIRNSYREQIDQGRKKVQKAREEFRRTAETNDDVAAVRLAYAPVAEAMENMAISRMLMKKEIDSVLTAEQTEKVKVLHAELVRNKPKHPPIAGPEWE